MTVTIQDVDLIKVMGTGGWQATYQDPVTPANQDQFAQILPPGCALRSVASPDLQMGKDSYMPPVGWTVVTATNQAGQEEFLWVDQAGKIWNTGKCIGAMPAGGAPVFQVTKTGGTSAWWIIAGVAALGLGYYLTRK